MTITKQPVTLTVVEVETLCALLNDYARYNWDHSRTTKSAAIRAYSQQRGNQCRDLEAALVKRLYVAQGCVKGE